MVDSRKSVASAILLGTLGVISFIIQPAEVEGLTAFEKISDGAANALVAYEMMGIAVAVPRQHQWHRFEVVN